MRVAADPAHAAVFRLSDHILGLGGWLSKRIGGKGKPSVFDKARNELLSHIRHCGVLKATAPQRDSWFKDTMSYMAERYPAVSPEQMDELETLGRRYCEPVISHGENGPGSG